MDKTNVEQETKNHIKQVAMLIDRAVLILKDRARRHDLSKMNPPELEIFQIYTERLKDTTYGSDEYKQFLKEMKPALDHHYGCNRHHPEHFSGGIKEMNLFDVMEMFCDWLAATQRHADGDIMQSILINKDRFGYGDVLEAIFVNTANAFLNKQE